MSAKKISIPTIYNVSLTTANQTYSQLLPDGTKKLEIRLSESGSTSAYLYAQFVSPAVASPYLTIIKGTPEKVDGLWLKDTTLYLKCNTPGQTAELMIWQ